jgi:hypothetical protein
MTTIVQVVIALVVLNVWTLRFGKSTSWRGGGARNMREEFEVYGLPDKIVGVVGFFKILFALLLLAGVGFPYLTEPAALGIGVLMLGAVAMHFKVHDPLKKSLPALTMLALCVFLVAA